MINFHDEAQKKIINEIKDDFKNVGFDSYGEYLWIYIMKGCGCGYAQASTSAFFKMFMKIGRKDKDCYDFIYKNKYNELIAQMLDSKGLLEHGSSIGGAWLSEAGEYLFELFNKPFENEGN